MFCPNTGLFALLALLAVGPLPSQTTQTIAITAVTNLADFQPGLPQQGSLASIVTTGLIGPPGVTLAQYPVPYTMNGVGVYINSVPAPILSLAFRDGYQQIDVQVPWEIPDQPTQVVVWQNGIQAYTAVPGAAGSPGVLSIFFADANGYGIVQHASDWSQVTVDNPAHAGEYLIAYAINLGPVSHQPATGAAAPFNPLAVVAPQGEVCEFSDIVYVTPISTFVSPLYSGLTPGSVGLYQINFQVAASAPPGIAALSWTRRSAVNEGNGCAEGAPVVYVTQVGRSVMLPIQ